MATQTALPETVVATVYFGLTNRLTLNWLRQSILDLPVANHWQNRSRAALLDILYDQGRVLTWTCCARPPTRKPRRNDWKAGWRTIRPVSNAAGVCSPTCGWRSTGSGDVVGRVKGDGESGAAERGLIRRNRGQTWQTVLPAIACKRGGEKR